MAKWPSRPYKHLLMFYTVISQIPQMIIMDQRWSLFMFYTAVNWISEMIFLDLSHRSLCYNGCQVNLKIKPLCTSLVYSICFMPVWYWSKDTSLLLYCPWIMFNMALSWIFWETWCTFTGHSICSMGPYLLLWYICRLMFCCQCSTLTGLRESFLWPKAKC